MRKQKKVLILGGIKQMIGIVEAAKRMGLYTIVTDNGFGASAKHYADEAYDFSPSDIASLAKLAAEEEIEGIFTAIDDINVWNALKLCKTAGLPMFASQEQLNMAAAKDKFLEFCEIFNVPVLQERVQYENAQADGQPASYSRNLLFLAQLGANEEQRNIEHSHKVKLYYTLHNKNFWGNQRPRLFIKSPSGSRRQTSTSFSKEGNKAASDHVLQ